MVSLLRSPNVPEAFRLIFFKIQYFASLAFFLALSLTALCFQSHGWSNKNPFIPCSLAPLSHCCNDWYLWQGLQLSQLPLLQGAFCVPSFKSQLFPEDTLLWLWEWLKGSLMAYIRKESNLIIKVSFGPVKYEYIPQVDSLMGALKSCRQPVKSRKQIQFPGDWIKLLGLILFCFN